MSKITFGSLNLKENNEITVFKFNDKEIEVKNYLSAQEKNKLIFSIINYIFAYNKYNYFMLNIYFHLYLIYYYTNITFTEKQKADELKLYDMLYSSGFLEEFLKNMPEDEYNELYKSVSEQIKIEITYINSITNAFTNFEGAQPDPKTMEIIENMNMDDYKELIKLAKDAGIALDN